MAARKLSKNNAEKGARRKEQRRRSKEVGLQTGVKANSDAAIAAAAKKKGVDVPKDNTKAVAENIKLRGKRKTAKNPIGTVKKKLAGQIRDIAKEKARKVASKNQPKKIKRAK